MEFHSMRQEMPEFVTSEDYEDHGEHCKAQRSAPLVVIRGNSKPIVGVFACYTWTDDEGFSEPSYCYETGDSPMDIVDVLYDDTWASIDEMKELFAEILPQQEQPRKVKLASYSDPEEDLEDDRR